MSNSVVPGVSGDPVGLVVVGGGAAAHSCIAAYTERGGQLPITMLSDDDRLPYFRPTVSKQLLTGELAADAIGIVDDPGWYALRDVTVRLSCRVTGLDLANRTLGTSAGPVPFAAVLLATGSDAATLPVAGADHPTVLRIRRAADAERLVRLVADSPRVLVIGSGFVGCEVAASLRRRGVEVSMASQEAAPQQDRLGEPVASLIAGWLADLGVGVHPGVQLVSLDHGVDGARATFSDGRVVEASTVVLATGASANLDVARTAGLVDDEEGAVPVDASMRTPAPGVFAAGDIVHADHPVAGRRLRVEHWGDAERMGAVAGAVLAGDTAEWRSVPGFWSDIGGRQLKYVAWGDGHDEFAARPSADGLTVWYGREGLVAGVLTYEHDEDLALGEDLIATKAGFSSVA